jgi:ABC-type branched-subunit amino acid transport system ATPase component
MANEALDDLRARVHRLEDESATGTRTAHVHLTLTVADSAAVLNRGSIVLRGRAAELMADEPRLQAAYLGSLEPRGS